MHRLLGLFASLLAVAACTTEVGGNGTTTTANGGAGVGGAGGVGGAIVGSTGGAGGAGLPPCDQPGMMGWQPTTPGYQPFACDLPQPCPMMMYESWSFGGPDQPPSIDMEAATCILTKLRDREVSALSWMNDKSGMQQWNETETVFIVDSEHAVSNWTRANDLDLYSGTRNRQILKPAAYFDGCLQLTDAKEIYACITGWSAGCADQPVSCPVP
ncbi:MAG: hypothetical protein QM820_39165 [Minicystis sp.]